MTERTWLICHRKECTNDLKRENCRIFTMLALAVEDIEITTEEFRLLMNNKNIKYWKKVFHQGVKKWAVPNLFSVYQL